MTSATGNRKRRQTFKRIRHQQGDKNSQYGTCWIYNLNLKKNKKIKKEEINDWISKGWISGRKIEF